jgi:hypothetical protein
VEHRRIRTQLLATSHRYRVFIICCLVTITVSQLGALLVALSSKDGKSFANSGDLLVRMTTLVAPSQTDHSLSEYVLLKLAL